MSKPDPDRRFRVRLRYTLRQLLGLVVLVALALPALVYPSLWWAAAWLSGCLLMLSVSLLGMINRNADRRAFWIGFALFGWAYLTMLYAPVLDRHVGHRLITTKVLAYRQLHLPRAAGEAQCFQTSPVEIALQPTAWISYTVSTETGTFPIPVSQWDFFQQVGHSLFALLLACFGGFVSRWFYSTRSRHCPFGPAKRSS
jgi:hypothetical protein